MLVLPEDDDNIEMEELEGMISVTAAPSSVGSKNVPRKHNGRTSRTVNTVCASLFASTGASNYYHRYMGMTLAMLVIVLLVFDGEQSADLRQDVQAATPSDDHDVVSGIVTPERSPTDSHINGDNKHTRDIPDIVETHVEPETKEESDATELAGADPATEAETQDQPETIEEPATKDEPASDTTPEIETKDDIDTPEETNAITEVAAAEETDPAKVQALIDQWGKWTFWDGEEELRPQGDYCANYRHRDIPGSELPPNAWQQDAVYANHFLDAAANLMTRAKNAIFAEYGLGDEEHTLTDEQKIIRSQMFHLNMVDFSAGETPNKVQDGGGWTTARSFEGLARRLLHAIMTNDTFTVVMGGHSAAAGHGNHFKQSYMMAFHKFMKPIFKRLGVTLITRQLAQGGLGTLHSTLGSGSIYGDDIDVLIWDSQMTETEPRAFDAFFRQALLAGKRPPFIIAADGYRTIPVLKMLHEDAGVDVGHLGTARAGVPVSENDAQAQTLPWAVQYLECTAADQGLCKNGDVKYRNQCWIERDDVVPPTKQRPHVAGAAGWHPGWRHHQLTGRVISFFILSALQDAINSWMDVSITEGYPLDDEYWHMSEYYDQMQEKVRNLNRPPKDQFCEEYADLQLLPKRICNTPLKGRTEFTPRNDPENTSITSIIKPTKDGYVPSLGEKMLYTGPDVPNPLLEVPDDELDVRDVILNRRLYVEDESEASTESNRVLSLSANNESTGKSLLRRGLAETIIPGSGWDVVTKLGNCDGTYDAICDRSSSSDCLLSGHMDARGGIHGDGLSGWLVLNLENVTEGLILLKLETWHPANSNPKTEGWTEENNAMSNRQVRAVAADNKLSEHRQIKNEPAEYCDAFEFQYSVDGVITSLNKDEFFEKRKMAQRVVEVLTILDDEEMAKEGKARDIEVGIRLRGCKREKHFSLTHVYWA